MISHRVTGGGGVDLHVVEAGDPKGRPIVFIHGWSQSHLAWRAQLEGERLKGFRLIAFDLRGHGVSAAPEAASQYQDGAYWAGDVLAVIRALKLVEPVLVGWSYGTVVIGDFLRRHRDVRLGGVVTVCGATVMGRVENSYPPGAALKAFAGPLVGTDRTAELSAAIGFVRAAQYVAPAPEAWAAQVGWMMWTRPDVRRNMSARLEDMRPDLSKARCPLMVLQGVEDQVVIAAQAQGLAALRPDAKLMMMEGIGHQPFAEAPDAFDKAIALFAAGQA